LRILRHTRLAKSHNKSMYRPCFLVVDRESSSAISTRKLIIETAKFNVITAYSSQEAIDTLKRFPALDGVVTDSGMTDMACDSLIAALKAIRKEIPVVVICTPRGAPSKLADHSLETFDPKQLLAMLQKLQPEATAHIEKRNEDLEEGYFRR
jgi:CheY-like chemotaxis protein